MYRVNSSMQEQEKKIFLMQNMHIHGHALQSLISGGWLFSHLSSKRRSNEWKQCDKQNEWRTEIDKVVWLRKSTLQKNIDDYLSLVSASGQRTQKFVFINTGSLLITDQTVRMFFQLSEYDFHFIVHIFRFADFTTTKNYWFFK